VKHLVVAVLISAGLARAQATNDAVLHDVPLETTVRGEVEWKQRQLRVALLDATQPPLFLTRRGGRPDAEGVFTLEGLDTPRSKDRPVARHKAASWVMDFDQASFAPAWKAALAEVGPKPTAAALTDFVARWLSRKSYDRALDLASQVAKHRSGDCTEHAVFLVALLRKAGIPSRAMLGVVLVAFPERARAFGHMWVEAFVDGQWRVFDAALGKASAAYLPAGEFSDEGPGYALGLVGVTNTLGFRVLELR
jgi:transglutaminase-like putative cysteine protease